MKKICCLCLCCLLIVVWNVSFAESLISLLEQSISAATDEELVQASSMIKEEQRSRLKTRIELDPAELSLPTGKNQKITGTVTDLPEGVKAGKFTWTVDDTSVVSCQNGSVRGVGAGNAIVTCSCVLSDGTEVSADCKVTVFVQAKSIKPRDKNAKVMASEPFVPKIDFQPADTTNKVLAYTSSDEKVIKVLEDGSLMAVAAGKAEISATTTDGSNKTAKISVEVTRKIGKYDGEITFQGIQWGSDVDSVFSALKELGLMEQSWTPYYHYSSSFNYWPNDDLKLTSSDSWGKVPPVLEGKEALYRISFSPETTFVGYKLNALSLNFVHGLKEDNSVDHDITQLVGVEMYMTFDKNNEKITDIFRTLLAKMEERYGAFTVYIPSNLNRCGFGSYRYDRELADLFNQETKIYESGVKFPDARYIDEQTGPGVLAVLHGANDTGIALWLAGSLEIFYGKTDAWKKVEELEKLLDTGEVPDSLGV